tara:strand:+ start:1194 stop:1343 length:150 start_codon:yes stop_codon:yes gene_type:complete
MKTNHTVKKGETIEFKNLQEVQEFAETHHYKQDEFECLSADPFVYKKVN